MSNLCSPFVDVRYTETNGRLLTWAQRCRPSGVSSSKCKRLQSGPSLQGLAARRIIGSKVAEAQCCIQIGIANASWSSFFLAMFARTKSRFSRLLKAPACGDRERALGAMIEPRDTSKVDKHSNPT